MCDEPLCEAAHKFSMAVAVPPGGTLLEAGADKEARNDRGQTPLHVAAAGGQVEG